MIGSLAFIALRRATFSECRVVAAVLVALKPVRPDRIGVRRVLPGSVNVVRIARAACMPAGFRMPRWRSIRGIGWPSYSKPRSQE